MALSRAVVARALGRVRSWWNRSEGLTLIEVVATLSLVGMVASFGAHGIRGALDREQIDGWARAIVYDLASGQQAAMTQRATVTATFQDRTYAIASAGGGFRRVDTLPGQMTFGSALRSVAFDRRGVPTGDATIVLTSTAAGLTYTISVEAGSGRVSFSGP
jgi:prepilin-type N-terminal cleavage/methylation domain-containing protein